MKRDAWAPLAVTGIVVCLGGAACSGGAKPPGGSADAAVDVSVEAAVEVSAEAPVDVSREAPVEVSVEVSGDLAPEASTDAATDAASDVSRDASTPDASDVAPEAAGDVRAGADGADGTGGTLKGPELVQLMTFKSVSVTPWTAFAADGSMYLAGAFDVPIDTDPSAATDLRTPVGFFDTFITKLNPDGTRAWTRIIGGTGAVVQPAAVLAAGGAVFISGKFAYAPVDFDPDPTTAMRTPAGMGSTFVMRIDVDGDFAWASTFAGSSSPAHSLAAGPDDSLYVPGTFSGTCDFDPGPGTDSHTVPNVGGFVVKLGRTQGNLIWPRVTAGDACPFGLVSALAIAPDGKVWIAAGAAGGCTFLGMSWPDGAARLGLVASLSAAGSVQNSAAFADPDLSVSSIAAAVDGSVYVSGYFTNSVDFDPGPGIVNRTMPAGNMQTSYLLKLGPNAEHRWVVTGHDADFVSLAPLDNGGVLAVEALTLIQGMTAPGFYLDRFAADSTSTWSVPFLGNDATAIAFGAGSSSFAVSGYTHFSLDVDPAVAQAIVDPDNGFWARYRY